MRFIAPLILLFATGLFAQPQPAIVLPASAPAGETVVVSGVHFSFVQSVTVRGVASPHVELIDSKRLAVELPQGLANGAADIVVTNGDGTTIVYTGFVVGPASRRTFAIDDIAEVDVATSPPLLETASFGWSTPAGPRMRADIAVRAVAFDPLGRLLLTDGVQASYYDTAFHRIGDAPAYFRDAVAIVFDGDGNSVSVLRPLAPGSSSRIERRAPDGVLLGTLNISETTQSADLAADQCTLYTTGVPFSNTGVHRYNVCTMMQLPAFVPPDETHDVRVLPDGDILTTGRSGQFYRFSPDGKRIDFFVGGPITTSIAIAADARAVWVSVLSLLWQINLSNDVLATRNDRHTAGTAYALAVYGGWTAARGFPAYAADPAISFVTLGDGGAITIHGTGFRVGTTFTINGVTIVIDEQTATLARGHVAGVGPQGGIVTVSTPDGKSATAAAGAAAPALGSVMLLLLAATLAAVAVRR